MIYLDYAANNPVNKKILDTYYQETLKYSANPNSSHTLGKAAQKEIDKASKTIAQYFNCSKEGIIYTSGSTESNNMVIKGVCECYKDKGKHIIISSIEHSSIIAPCNFETNYGFEVTIIPIKEDGIVDLEELKKSIREDTILVSISSCDSELGTIQPIKVIGDIVHTHPNCLFHTDATGAIGKTNLDFSSVDFITFSPHKFGGLNGMGVLVNRNNKKIIPLIHGGKSTTIYRSGTPVVANCVCTSMALSLAIKNLDNNIKYTSKLKEYLINKLKTYPYIHINTPKNSVSTTINISLINLDINKVLKELNKKEIYLSTTSACSKTNYSKSVYAITKDNNLANNTLRISISRKTTKKEIDTFLKELNNIYEVIKNANN